MKKLICIAVCAVMLAATFAVSSVSAGDILFRDNFDSGVFSEADWRVEGSLFAIENGGPTKSPHLEGWAEAVVQQTSYGEGAPAPRVYGANFAVKCDTWFYDDGGNGSDEHWVGLWWADHFEDYIGGDRIIYSVRVIYETRSVVLVAYGENGGTEYFGETTVLSEWKLPDDEPLEMDTAEPTVFNLGMRINGTQIDGFYNDQKVVSATAPIMHEYKCPLLFWNYQCYTGFDNWVVSTADYNLFNESATPAPAPGPAETETEKVIETKVVHETDEEGNDVTVIVTEEVVRPVANTGSSTVGGNSAKTGDAAVIVACVLIVSFGAALVVKKIALK